MNQVKMKGKIFHQLLFGLTFMFLALSVMGQGSLEERADKAYEFGNYSSAAVLYQKIIYKNPETRIIRKLADCHLRLMNAEEAEYWYRELANSNNALPEDHLGYGKALKLSGKYGKAMRAADQYEHAGGDPDVALNFRESCKFAMHSMDGSLPFSVKMAPFNSEASDIAPAFYQNGLVFSSAREHGAFVRLTDKGTGEMLYDLYFVDLTQPDSDPEALAGQVNSRMNDAAVSFTADGSKMYLTRNFVEDGSLPTDDKGKNHLQVLSTEYNGRKWRNVEAMDFNNVAFSTGHPSVTEGENSMFFVSNRPGGKGGADIYVVRKTESGWSQPENLGGDINTEGDELFPYIYQNEVLFFASDGHPGYGGLDIFYSVYEDGKWSKPKNAGYPLNSSGDDFGITINKYGTTGYVSSNRFGGKGGDDIYEFKTKAKVTGTVVDRNTGKPVPGAVISMLGSNRPEDRVETNEKGEFVLFGQYNSDLFLEFSADDYNSEKKRVSTRDIRMMEEINLMVDLQRTNLFTVSGNISDEATGDPINDVMVRILSEKGMKNTTSGNTGSFSQELGHEEEDFTVVFTRDGYVPQLKTISTMGLTDPKVFEMDLQLKPGRGLVVRGNVIARDSDTPIGNARVATISALEQKEIGAMETDSKGRFIAVIDGDDDAYLLAGAPNRYFSERVDVPSPDSVDSGIWRVTIEMSPYRVGELVRTVNFGYNKTDITREAGNAIFSLVFFLKDNPDANVELSAHTDSRGGNQYNESLSQERAEAVKKFIVERGVSGDRITAKGYGESKLLNNCSDGRECTDEQHGENRRCELTILGIGK